MPHLFPFPVENFDAYCNGLQRVGIDCGFILYADRHAGTQQPAFRLLSTDQVALAKSYLAAPTDELFRRMVEAGILLDTEWDRKTQDWQIISFRGWDALHTAFCRLYASYGERLTELTGLSGIDMTDAP